MLHSYTYNGREFKFLRGARSRSNENIFTLIVGKNGTGKSTLLRSIVIDLLRDNINPTSLRVSDILVQQRKFPVGEIKAKTSPTKVICVSTSPFDKFPFLRKNFDLNYYSYLGLRGLQSQSLGMAYMAKIIYTLISAAQKSSDHANSITQVLDYLDYEPEILVNFSVPSTKLIDILASSDGGDLREIVENYFDRFSFSPIETNSLARQLVDIDEKSLRQIHKAVMRLSDGAKRPLLVARLGSFGVDMHGGTALQPEDLSLLGRYGLIRLKEVSLQKKGWDTALAMSDMSSGEQSVIMGLLGIGSQLQDGALVCVDEPEICLHPEWQERYIQLFSKIFSHYKGCHFIIATHSPQMVAQLPERNCYVMDMETGVAHPSSEFARNSIDYQLATLFKAPGFKNEYLSRLALNIFMGVAKNKRFEDDELEQFKLLDTSYSQLREDDPLREIIETLREMHHQYGGY